MDSRNVVRIVDNCLSGCRRCGDYLVVTVVPIELQGKSQIVECSAHLIVVAACCSCSKVGARPILGCSAITGRFDELVNPQRLVMVGPWGGHGNRQIARQGLPRQG